MSNLFGRRAFEHQITDEVRFHIESRAADLVRSGIRPADAARRARLEFGAPERWKEEMREARGLGWIDAARVDLRYALRTLRKNPAFAFVAILSLALGIGANTAIFHVLNVVRLRALPIPDPGRLASVRAKDSHGGMGVNSFPADMTYPLFEQVLTAFVNVARLGLPRERRERFKQELLDRLDALPEVEAAATTTNIPLFGSSWTMGVRLVGAPDERRSSKITFISPGYFRTMRIPLLRGREFTVKDDKASAGVAIVNQTFIQQFLNGVNPIGQAFQTGQEPGYPAATYEIVGIVADTKYSRLREEIRPIAFIPAAQHPSPQDGVAIIIRASGPVSAVPPAVRRLLANLDSRIALAGISDYETQIRETLVQERLMAALSGFFGQLAMIIAAIGLYGLVSYIVSTRQHELGLRVALGATRANVLGLVLRQSLMLVACGLVIGVPAALLLTRWMTSLVFGLSPRDVPTIAMAVTMLAVVALGAALIPARRAASVDPMVALRVE
jgi:predicted permease